MNKKSSSLVLAASPKQFWQVLSLAKKFLIAGGLVVMAGALIIGFWVADRIEQGVTRNAAIATALYVDSFISPITRELENSDVLSVGPINALDEIFKDSPVGNRLVSVKIWSLDGTIVYNNDYEQIGKKFDITDELSLASTGEVVASFASLTDAEDEAERQSGMPLLEIYSPIRAPWSGNVIAVVEFYEDGTELLATLARARFQSWVLVAAVMSGMAGMLMTIVFQGSRTIDQQKKELQNRLSEVTEVSNQNMKLRERVQRASARVSELNEHFLKKTSAELHDGPAQLLSFAALRIGEVAKIRETKTRNNELKLIAETLDTAMQEIRNISKGLSLPEIKDQSIQEIIKNVTRHHIERTKNSVRLVLPDQYYRATTPINICVYRFVQEALNNSSKHAGDGEIVISAKALDAGQTLEIRVRDNGPGFDLTAVDANGDRMGLQGLRERVRSIGGELHINSTIESGTELIMSASLDPKINTEEQANG